MSNDDNVIVRVFKLWAKISMMVVDGTRDATMVANALQSILNLSTFNPSVFIGDGWSYDESRDPRSAKLGLLDDYSKIKLSTDWLQGKTSLDGKTRRRFILEDSSSIPLNCDHFLDLWNNKKKIPEEWKKVGYISFDGDVLLSSNGSRCVLGLCWDGGGWDWFYIWLDSEFDADYQSAVLAS